jgi:hypothetical protein
MVLMVTAPNAVVVVVAIQASFEAQSAEFLACLVRFVSSKFQSYL